MQIIRNSERELVLEEKPWLVRGVGILFVIAGTFVAFQPDGRLFGAAFALVGAALLLAFANTVTCTFALDSRRFTKVSKGLLRSTRDEHSIDDIAGVRVEQNSGGRNRPGYRLALVLSSSDRVPFTTSYSSGRKDKDALAQAIRDKLGLEDPGEVPIPGFSDMAHLMFDPNAIQKLSEMYGGVLSQYETAIEKDPDNVEARRQLGTALAMQNRPDEARLHLMHARGVVARQGNTKLVSQFDTMIREIDKARR